MTNQNRILSIDIMRGLTLLLMLFLNDLNTEFAPRWLGHMESGFDGLGVADWVFPGFLFIVGMSIPFALSKRFSIGDDTEDIGKHILARSVSLIIIGVLMLNIGRIDSELTGFGKNLWALLMYTAVFLFWNDYRDNKERIYTVAGYKLAALAIFIFLVFKFRSGEAVNSGSLITGWWGILGLIGWGYLVSAFTYVICRDSIWKTLIVAGFFFAMNILTELGLLNFLKTLNPYIGVLTGGNVPFMVLCGLVSGLLLNKFAKSGSGKIMAIFIILGLSCVAAGFILRHWFIISKIKATPSWGMLCTGISFLLFIFIYWIVDVRGKQKWANFLIPAGQHSLTTYLLPAFLYHLIWLTGVPLLVYKQSSSPWIVIGGSIIWALAMAGLTALLVRFNVKLKL